MDERSRRLILRRPVWPVWGASCRPPAWEFNTDWLWYNFIFSLRKPTLISTAVIDLSSRNILIPDNYRMSSSPPHSCQAEIWHRAPAPPYSWGRHKQPVPDTVRSVITTRIIVDSSLFQLSIVLGLKSNKMEPRIEIPSKNLVYNSDRFSQTACNSQSYREVFGNNCSNILRTSSSSYFLNKMYSIVFGKFYMKLIFIVFNISVYCTCT